MSEQSLSLIPPPGHRGRYSSALLKILLALVLRIYTPSQYGDAYNDYMLDSIRTADTLTYDLYSRWNSVQYSYRFRPPGIHHGR